MIPRVLGRKNREYSDEDINVIWTIRMLRNIGYSLKEVDLMIKSPQFDLEESIEEKIVRLGTEREEKERQLEYAKTLKKTGKFPVMSKETGVVEVKTL